MLKTYRQHLIVFHSHKYLAFFVLVFIFFSSKKIDSQNLPPILNYTSEIHDGGNQNWAISQDENKFIYVANNKGLLEYNGAQWNLYLSPNETIFRSVKVIEDKIYTGFYMDFGFWKRNLFGKLEFTSLVALLNIKVIEDEQFWNILQLDEFILFQSLSRIYLYNTRNNDVNIIESREKLTKMFKVDKTIYFQRENMGLFKIENGKAILVSDDYLFTSCEIINMYKHDSGFFIVTDSKGIYLLENNQVSPWSEANSSLISKTVYSSIQSKNGEIILGTISNGVIFIGVDGTINTNVEQKNGLNNNTVLSLYEDIDENIWLGLDHGISLINASSNISVYKNHRGNLGTVYTSAVYKENLYLGSNQGLFYKKLKSNDNFELIPKTEGQVWNLRIMDSLLFCSHDSGLFIIDKDSISYTIDNQSTWDVKFIDDTTMLSGNYFGMSVLRKKLGKWMFSNKLNGFQNSSKHFEILSNNTVFVNHEYKGVFKIELDSDYRNVISVVKDSSVEKGIHSSIVKYNNTILYASSKGVYSYSNEKESFERNEDLSSTYTDSTFVSGKLIFDKKNNRLWSFSSKHINYILPGKLSDKPIINQIPISQSLREGAVGYENIYPLDYSKNLIGTNNGYIILDIGSQENKTNNLVYINSVTSHKLNAKSHLLQKNKKEVLPYVSNSLEFQFSTPQFNKAFAPINLTTNSLDHLLFDYYFDGTFSAGKQVTVQILGANGLNTSYVIDLSSAGRTSGWNRVNVPLSSLSQGGGADFSGVNTFQFIGQGGADPFGNLYVANVIFYEGGTASTNDANLVESLVLGNPTDSEWKIRTPNNTIQSVQVFNILGKQVYNASVNRNEVGIPAHNLRSGIYIARIQTDSGTKSIKLIRN